MSIEHIRKQLKEGDNEGSAYPWWLIIDPKQNFEVNEDGVYRIAEMITGPFFSRAAAKARLEGKAHHFSKNAKVFCHSGHASYDYIGMIKELTTESEEIACTQKKN